MTLENLRTDTNYALLNSAGKVIFTCDDADRAVIYANRVFPEWRTASESWSVVKITTTYEKLPA